jgi:hypothetical protein
MKLKADASGYTAWVRSPADEERYIEWIWKSEWIRLDRGTVRRRAAKRGLAKLCLNSMRGKLTKRNDRTRAKITTEPHELYRFLATPGVIVTNLAFASDDVVWLSWKLSAEEYVPNLLTPMRSSELTLLQVQESICIVFSTHCKRTRSIVTLIRLYLFSRLSSRGRSQLGTCWGHVIWTDTLPIHCRIHVWGSNVLNIQGDHQ